jgi:predicted  nucleic acid-binding Zn-ribbon protein
VAGEEFDRRVKAAEAALHAMEGEVAVERTQIAAEKAAVEQEQTALETQHAAARALVPGELIDLYQKIAKRHHGVGLAQVRGESCGQCGFMVRPHVVQDMRRETEEVFRCEGCSRILFYVEAAPQAAAAQGK